MDDDIIATTLRSNIEACLALDQCLRSTLGPYGRDKLIVDEHGDYIVSNDGATILRYLQVKHPATKLLISLAKAQDDTVGDGTTSVVLLTCALLQCALRYLNPMSIHPRQIQNGYQVALDLALKMIKDIEVPIPWKEDEERARQMMYDIALTSISSKILARFKEHFARLGVDAIMRLGTTQLNQDRIKVIAINGNSMMESKLVDGVLLRYPPSNDSERRRTTSRCLMTHDPKDGYRVAVGKLQLQKLQSEMHSVKESLGQGGGSASASFQQQEQAMLKAKIQPLLNLHANVIVSDTDIPAYLDSVLEEHGIDYFCISDSAELEVIAANLAAPLLYDIKGVTDEMLARPKAIELVAIGDDSFLQITGVERSNAATVIIRSPTDTMSQECVRSFKDMLNILFASLHNPFVIGGGGCVFMYIANRLRTSLKGTSNEKLQVVVGEYANALESIPALLTHNAGFDSLSTMTRLKTLHAVGDGDNRWKGVNLDNGEIVDMFVELDVKEPSFLLTNILTLATRAAQMILRINSNILIEPRVAFRPPGTERTPTSASSSTSTDNDYS
ncbi:hypothetical protein SAMD00019534_085120 [Acytostelium subglobosum LB1]|uniref:hypothetical protein n=1 Tax=Acytostelium subglobosum LB1 TaxID=1410327 RepID=UPI000644F0F3|nr:hypothetical protein SAMD00019534_085120 [Acytostelium subglobosum LB1]GAM25337.1 hypothetical protein SAMD00019534_085120 [Acytostelium subglobosum LB1]|eukprot:XP_012751857.1 hypothetical protein SAMD00019534_085120 [Acytostelium subglobosum LB1]